MFSAFRKFVQIKSIAANSIAFSLALIDKNRLPHEPGLFRICKVECFANLCSLVEVDSSGLPSKSRKKSCKSENELEKAKSRTVSFLINSCGLSPEMAISASEKVRFENTEKPSCVITLLKHHGFNETQVANIVRKRPSILLINEETLSPKLEFFNSLGSSGAYLAAISSQPVLLTGSLENRLIPSYNFLKSLLLTDDKIAVAMKCSSRIFQQNPNKNMAPNVAFLRELKVPDSCIILLLTHYPETIAEKTDEFRESVRKVLEMGFDPLRSMFVLALHVVAEKGNRGIWDRCYQTYRSWGWSKDDVYLAFRRHPNCMILSENKISRTMDFLVNKMGWDSQIVLGCPAVLLYNLENRIVPRCNVIRILLSRNLIFDKIKLSSFLLPSETRFLDMFVTKHEKEVPELYGVYEGKIGLEELASLNKRGHESTTRFFLVGNNTGNVQIGVKLGLIVCCYGSIATMACPISTIFEILQSLKEERCSRRFMLKRQLEQDMETVVKVLQPGPLGIIEHKFTAEEINKAKSIVNQAVENWQRYAYVEGNSPFLRDFISKDRM
ncbi:Mitochondrial transcription termination factor family protein [Dorcoceras hygrometricum]|uniref:Mitochondrial transcription termination factor family protein n=1 Tax=Dorcoceras hygrometricum TaxID=472368 RepID=A0A2Z7D5W7_9LAMI|nr:Mitochondrial transcription termination factor family protein [Dorcoceras hygrometricum]